jgi:hypothetical protein
MAYFGRKEITEAVGSLGLPLYIDGKQVTRPLTIRHGALSGGCGCSGVDGKLSAFRDGSLGSDGLLAAYRDGSLGAAGLLAAYRDGSLGADSVVIDLSDGKPMAVEFRRFLAMMLGQLNESTQSTEHLPWYGGLWSKLWGIYSKAKQLPGAADLGITEPTLVGVQTLVMEAAMKAGAEPTNADYSWVKESPLAAAVGRSITAGNSVKYIPPGGSTSMYLYAGAAAAAVVVAALLFRGKKRR